LGGVDVGVVVVAVTVFDSKAIAINVLGTALSVNTVAVVVDPIITEALAVLDYAWVDLSVAVIAVGAE
jgi:hypothetical protein